MKWPLLHCRTKEEADQPGSYEEVTRRLLAGDVHIRRKCRSTAFAAELWNPVLIFEIRPTEFFSQRDDHIVGPKDFIQR